MIVCQACIADTVVTLYSVVPPAPDEERASLRPSFELHFRDLPTGESDCLVIEGENEAILTFAAWLAADEEHIGVLEKRLRRLHATVGQRSKKFMP